MKCAGGPFGKRDVGPGLGPGHRLGPCLGRGRCHGRRETKPPQVPALGLGTPAAMLRYMLLRWHRVARVLALALAASVMVACGDDAGPSDGGIDAGKDAGGDASTDAGQDAGQDAGACPDAAPFSGTCEGALHCEYGTESCCGETYPSLVCNCVSGDWQCFNTDACLIPADGGCLL